MRVTGDGLQNAVAIHISSRGHIQQDNGIIAVFKDAAKLDFLDAKRFFRSFTIVNIRNGYPGNGLTGTGFNPDYLEVGPKGDTFFSNHSQFKGLSQTRFQERFAAKIITVLIVRDNKIRERLP